MRCGARGSEGSARVEEGGGNSASGGTHVVQYGLLVGCASNASTSKPVSSLLHALPNHRGGSRSSLGRRNNPHTASAGDLTKPTHIRGGFQPTWRRPQAPAEPLPARSTPPAGPSERPTLSTRGGPAGGWLRGAVRCGPRRASRSSFGGSVRTVAWSSSEHDLFRGPLTSLPSRLTECSGSTSMLRLLTRTSCSSTSHTRACRRRLVRSPRDSPLRSRLLDGSALCVERGSLLRWLLGGGNTGASSAILDTRAMRVDPLPLHPRPDQDSSPPAWSVRLTRVRGVSDLSLFR